MDQDDGDIVELSSTTSDVKLKTKPRIKLITYANMLTATLNRWSCRSGTIFVELSSLVNFWSRLEMVPQNHITS